MHTVDLTGKRALVTGSSRGLGRYYALHLAQAGADVTIHDVHEHAAAEFGEAPSGPAVAEEIRALGRQSAFFSADLTDPAQAERLVQQALTTLGRLDILVNNAGGDIGCRTPRPTRPSLRDRGAPGTRPRRRSGSRRRSSPRRGARAW